MKRFTLIFLCVCLAAGLLACQKEPTNTTDQTSDSRDTRETTVPADTGETILPEEPTDPAPVTTAPGYETDANPLIAVSLNPVMEPAEAEDGTVIFQYSYQDVNVYIPQNLPAAQAIQEQMHGLIEESAGTAENIKAWAEENYKGETDWLPYSYSITLTPTLLNSTVLSFSGELWDYAGGVHPNVTLISCSFSPVTGEMLHLRDVLSEEGMVDALYSMVLDKLTEYVATIGTTDSVYQDGYENTVAAHFDLDKPAEENWYLTDTGMTFSFSPYEIASYAVGSIQVELTYGELRGILREPYFPESASYDATLSINSAKAAQIDKSQFENVLPVAASAEGEEIVLFSGTTLYEVRMISGSWVQDQFVDTQTIFAANRMTAEDLLLIRASIPDTQPNLSIVVRTGEGDDRTYFISQSGEDGSILLLDSAGEQSAS